MNMELCLKILRIFSVPSIIMLIGMTFAGCGATRMMLRYGDLSEQTEMSGSVFLELRSNLPQTVYISETSTAGRDLTIRPALDRQIIDSGYSLVDTPDDATYIIQINHLRIAEFELSGNQTLSDALSASWMAGAGAALAAHILDAADAALELGLVVGVIGFILDAKTKHIAHTLTTDMLLTETVLVIKGEREVHSHEVQIVSGASKVNLDYEESLPAIISGLSRSLAGLLPTESTLKQEG